MARRAAEAALCLEPSAAALVRKFCRKCRIYNCLTHPEVPMPRCQPAPSLHDTVLSVQLLCMGNMCFSVSPAAPRLLRVHASQQGLFFALSRTFMPCTCRPHVRPLPTRPDATAKPCSAECYKLVPRAVVAPLGHPAMPVERVDSMPKRRGKGRGRHAKRACHGSAAQTGNGGCARPATAVF